LGGGGEQPDWVKSNVREGRYQRVMECGRGEGHKTKRGLASVRGGGGSVQSNSEKQTSSTEGRKLRSRNGEKAMSAAVKRPQLTSGLVDTAKDPKEK